MRLLIASLFVISLCAQTPQEGAKKGGPPPAPKNLKVLKVQGPELLGAMRSYVTGLGVAQKGGCGFCHVADRASDELEHKQVARKMIVMVQEINASFPDGKEHVTCYTCHRGETEPKTAPPAA